jgi:MFS family permease
LSERDPIPDLSGQAARPGGFHAPFRNRNYRLYFVGQLISLVGFWMQAIAQAWLVYRLTDSPLLLGLAGFAGQIPMLVVTPFAGVLADRMPRRQILFFTQAAMMA